MAQSILLPHEPLLLVHKRWSSARGRTAAANAQDNRSKFLGSSDDVTVKAMPSCKAKGQRSRPRSARYEFVNATKPSTKQDKGVRRFVRSHVMKDIARSRRTLQEDFGGGNSTKLHDACDTAITGSDPGPVDPATSASSWSYGVPPICPGSATALFGAVFPFTINVHFRRLIEYCRLQNARCVLSYV